MNEDTHLKGIGGWLLLLCLFLTALDPATMLFGLFRMVDYYKPRFTPHPEMFWFVLADGVLRIGLITFSMYSGFMLWRKEPNAVTTVLIYFRAFFGYALLMLLLPRLLQLDQAIMKEIYPAYLLNAISVFAFYVVLWPIYLRRSKRVRATFFEEDDGKGGPGSDV
jgi:hypothetical protein